jgi:hypothetical protein
MLVGCAVGWRRHRSVEDCFAEAKNEAGLDHYRVRKYGA